MTTASSTLAVVATQLPQTDRRALSQAWYSALHLAVDAPPRGSVPTTGAPPAPAAPGRAPTACARAPLADVKAASAGRPAPLVRNVPGVAVGVDRRAPASELARRIERALVRSAPTAARQPVTVAIKVSDGRVHVLVRRENGRTRIVALCAPHLRECVDRALAQARFTLAARGVCVVAA